MLRSSVSHLRAKLGQYMREVRAGREVLVTDRNQPVAKLVPAKKSSQPESLRKASPREVGAPPLGKVEVRGLAFRGTDTTALLREDRKRQ